jgi:hypothetical protein
MQSLNLLGSQFQLQVLDGLGELLPCYLLLVCLITDPEESFRGDTLNAKLCDESIHGVLEGGSLSALSLDGLIHYILQFFKLQVYVSLLHMSLKLDQFLDGSLVYKFHVAPFWVLWWLTPINFRCLLLIHSSVFSITLSSYFKLYFYQL